MIFLRALWLHLVGGEPAGVKSAFVVKRGLPLPAVPNFTHKEACIHYSPLCDRQFVSPEGFPPPRGSYVSTILNQGLLTFRKLFSVVDYHRKRSFTHQIEEVRKHLRYHPLNNIVLFYLYATSYSIQVPIKWLVSNYQNFSCSKLQNLHYKRKGQIYLQL